MRLVCFSDLHLSNDSVHGDFDERGENEYLKIRRDVALHMIKQAAKVDGILIIGDTIDARVVDAHTLSATSKIISKIDKLPFAIMVSGNHELDLRVEGGVTVIDHYKHLRSNKDFHIASRETIVRKGDVEFFVLPHIPDLERTFEDRVKRYLNKSAAVKRVMLLHYGIVGASLGAIKSSTGISDEHVKSFASDFDFIVCGDYHKSQFIGGCDNVFYCGSPLQQDFGERDDEHGFWTIDTRKGTTKFTEITSELAPKFIEVTCPEPSSVKAYVKKLLKQDIDGNNVRFVVCASKTDAVDKAAITERISCVSKPRRLYVSVSNVAEKRVDIAGRLASPTDFLHKAVSDYVEARAQSKSKKHRKKLKQVGIDYLSL